MRSTIILMFTAATALAGCSQVTGRDEPARGVAALNEPVITRADYAIDLAAPSGMLPPTEMARLDGWFSALELGYGDSIHVAGPYALEARGDVARVASKYGMTLTEGAPVVGGPLGPGSVRVVVSRTRADVPGCPNWSEPAQPNPSNRMMPGFGCAVNGNMAAMVANPNDLARGRDVSGLTDTRTAVRPVTLYRTAPPTGTKGLQDVNTQKDK